MSAPLPKKSLSGHCSVVNDNTLYVLSPDSFQSLPLKENATWSTLPTGKSVTGPACVTATPNGDQSQAALYVIGGTTSDDSYGGMQRFFFSNQSWETLTPLTSDMKGRTDHSVAYLNDSRAILVYAGSQPQAPSSLSSQTFLISADEPYDISAFTSTAPPTNQPILLPWDSNSAVMLGGEENNMRIFTFGPDAGWEALDTNLTSALDTGVRATLVAGSDGSKVLQVYDAKKSPNTVENLVLLGAGGKAASNGETVGTSSSSSSRKRKRDLTLSNWPEYNSTDAPSTQRSDYSVAQGSNGVVVLSGGNDDNPINIYNQEKNAWVDNDVFFGSSADQVPLTSATPSATSSSASATSATAAATSTEPAGLQQSTSNHTRRTLGITLGVLAGVAVLMAAALLYMRWRKNKKKTDPGYVDEKADRLSFADRGASFMKEAGGSVAELNRMGPPPRNMFHQHNDSNDSLAIFGVKQNGGPNANNRMDNPAGNNAGLAPPNMFSEKNNSHSSLMIIAGKFGANRHSRNTGEKGSFESTTRLVRSPSAEARNEPGLELDEITTHSPDMVRRSIVAGGPQHAAGGQPEYEQQSSDPSPLQVKKRSSGWSKYFAPGEGNGYQQARQTSGQSVSEYTVPSRMPSSLHVPPLDFNKDLEAQRMSAVAKGRPSYNHSADDLVARGASLDSVRPQTAAFHTGNSLEPDNYLDDRDSFHSQNRRHSSDSMSSRITSSIFFSGNDGGVSTSTSAWTPVSKGVAAKPIRGDSSSGIKEIHVPAPSPRVGQLQRGESNAGFARPPSSQYSASIAPGRDSRLPFTANDLPGRALSPPIEGPTAVEIPGPAARAAMKGNAGFFPSNKDASRLPPRKIGALHPGTLAAISYSGLSTADLAAGKIKRIDPDGDNRDSNVTVWPSDETRNGSPSQKYLEERARLMREREQKQNGNFERERLERQAREMREKELREGTGTNESVMSGISEYSWLNLGAGK